MKKKIIELDGNPVVLMFNEFENEIDIDELLLVNHGNLYGEAVTIPVLLNTVNILKAGAARYIESVKLDIEVMEAKLGSLIRKNAATTGRKLNETIVKEDIIMDPAYQNLKKKLAIAKENHEIIEGVWWAAKSKDKKIDNIVKGASQKEIYEELIEERVNNVLIKKFKRLDKVK